MESLKMPEEKSPAAINSIREFIIDQFLFGEDDGFDEHSLLLDGGYIDSIGIMEIIVFIESTFGIQVADPELVPENFSSLSSMGLFLQTKGIY